MPLDNLFAIDEYADLSIFVIGVSTGAVVVELSLRGALSGQREWECFEHVQN